MSDLEEIIPKASLVIYSDKSIEYRDIKSNGQVGPARKLYQKTINRIFSHLDGEKEFSNWSFEGLIPNHILYVNNTSKCVVWYFKPCVKDLLFSNGKKNNYYHIPGLIFKILGNKLSVVAVKDKVISLNTEIYKAPFSNIYDNGVCMGTAALKLKNKMFYKDIVKHAEQRFFGSKFSSLHEDMVLSTKRQRYSKTLKKHKKYNSLKDFIDA